MPLALSAWGQIHGSVKYERLGPLRVIRGNRRFHVDEAEIDTVKNIADVIEERGPA